MWFSTMADRMVWRLPSMSRDRKWPHVTKCTHLRVVVLRLDGNLTERCSSRLLGEWDSVLMSVPTSTSADVMCSGVYGISTYWGRMSFLNFLTTCFSHYYRAKLLLYTPAAKTPSKSRNATRWDFSNMRDPVHKPLFAKFMRRRLPLPSLVCGVWPGHDNCTTLLAPRCASRADLTTSGKLNRACHCSHSSVISSAKADAGHFNTASD